MRAVHSPWQERARNDAHPHHRLMDVIHNDLLRQQDNTITRRQALDHMSLATLRHLLRTRWQVLLPGVYLAATGTPSNRQRLRAALLYGGDSAQICDRTALVAYGVRYLPPDSTIRLLLSAAAKRANRDGVEVRRTHRPPVPRLLAGLPHAPPERSLVEFAARIGDRVSRRPSSPTPYSAGLPTPRSWQPRCRTSQGAEPGPPGWPSPT
jgi:hypothetical protein